jgi:RHS repeat-associated protein
MPPLCAVRRRGSTVDRKFPGTRTLYEPYGAPLTTPREGAPSYTGHQYDTSTGMLYAQQRYYDPQLGVFMSPDPMAVDTTSAFNFNRYAYANNSPYKFTDPDGRFAWIAVGAPLAAAAILYAGYYVATHPIGNSSSGQSDGLSGLLGQSDTLPIFTKQLNESAEPEGQTGTTGNGSSEAPALPTGLVGEKPRQTGKSGGTAIGTSLPADRFPETVKELTGESLGPPDKNGRRVSPNGVAVRPNGKDGPRIDVPGNGTKPPEIIHFPPGTPVPDSL